MKQPEKTISEGGILYTFHPNPGNRQNSGYHKDEIELYKQQFESRNMLTHFVVIPEWVPTNQEGTKGKWTDTDYFWLYATPRREMPKAHIITDREQLDEGRKEQIEAIAAPLTKKYTEQIEALNNKVNKLT